MHLFQKLPSTENTKYSLLTKENIIFKLKVDSKIYKLVSIYRFPSQTNDEIEKLTL